MSYTSNNITTPITVTIIPDRRNVYRVEFEGQTIIERTSTPLLSAARVLLAMGFHPDQYIGLVRPGTPHQIDLKMTIGRAAKLTVSEPATTSRPKFAPFRPWTEDAQEALR